MSEQPCIEDSWRHFLMCADFQHPLRILPRRAWLQWNARITLPKVSFNLYPMSMMVFRFFCIIREPKIDLKRALKTNQVNKGVIQSYHKIINLLRKKLIVKSSLKCPSNNSCEKSDGSKSRRMKAHSQNWTCLDNFFFWIGSGIDFYGISIFLDLLRFGFVWRFHWRNYLGGNCFLFVEKAGRILRLKSLGEYFAKG